MPRNLIRLGCIDCDRTDFDGMSDLPTDWIQIQPVSSRLALGWETHLGLCPDCQRASQRLDADGDSRTEDDSTN